MMKAFTFYIQARTVIEDGSYGVGIPVTIEAPDAKAAVQKLGRALDKLAAVPEHHNLETRQQRL